MHFLKLLAPAALVALAHAQFSTEEEQSSVYARDETPGYEDLGVFVRDLDHDDLELEIRDAEADVEEFLSEATDLIFAREADAFGEFDSLAELEGRDAEPEAEAEAEAEAKKKKNKKNKKKKHGKKRKSKKRKACKKGKKGAKCRARRKAAKAKKAKKAKKLAAQRKKEAKQDAIDAKIWGL